MSITAGIGARRPAAATIEPAADAVVCAMLVSSTVKGRFGDRTRNSE